MSFAEGYLMGLQLKERRAQEAVRQREWQQQLAAQQEEFKTRQQDAFDDRAMKLWELTLPQHQVTSEGGLVTLPGADVSGPLNLLKQHGQAIGLNTGGIDRMLSGLGPSAAPMQSIGAPSITAIPGPDLSQDPGIQNLLKLVPTEQQAEAKALTESGLKKADLVRGLSGLINKPPTEQTAAEQSRYLGILQKQKLGQPVTAEEKAFTASYEHMKEFAGQAAQQIRIEGLQQMREYPVIDTETGSLQYLNPQVLNQAPAGKYAPVGAGMQAMSRRALIEDIRGGIQNVTSSLKALKTGFSTADRAQLAAALADPSSTLGAYAQSFFRNLGPDQQQYVIDLFSLREQAMAMRSVLGAGTGSEDMRRAIIQTLPGPGTPSADYAQKQLDRFSGVLDRLERGVPNVPLPGGAGARPAPTPTPAAAAPAQATPGQAAPDTAGKPPSKFHFSKSAWRQLHPRASDRQLQSAVQDAQDKGYDVAE
jgi:hypothetical protein